MRVLVKCCNCWIEFDLSTSGTSLSVCPCMWVNRRETRMGPPILMSQCQCDQPCPLRTMASVWTRRLPLCPAPGPCPRTRQSPALCGAAAGTRSARSGPSEPARRPGLCVSALGCGSRRTRSLRLLYYSSRRDRPPPPPSCLPQDSPNVHENRWFHHCSLNKLIKESKELVIT